MAKQNINFNSSGNKSENDHFARSVSTGLAQSLRSAFTKVNENFTELYNNTDLSAVAQNILPATTETYDLGSPEKPWRSLYVSENTVYFGNKALSVNQVGAVEVDGVVIATPAGIQANVDWNATTGVSAILNKPTIPADINDLTDTEGLLGGGGTQLPSQTGQEGKFLRTDGEELSWVAMTGGAGPVQPYLELTNSPFIVQPVVLGSPVTVSTAGDGSGAQVEVVIGAGPVITSVTVTTPGTGYTVGQRYRVRYWEIGGNNDDSHIEFEVATVSSGGLLTVTDAAFTGEAAANTPGTYSNLDMQYRASPGDSIGPGLTLVRSYQGALFNIEVETEYDDNNYTSPLGTEWNSDGWGDLSGLPVRTYTTFRDALNGNVGNNIIGAELVMHDTINDQYYKFSFSNWGGNNGGSYAYTRTLIERDPNYFKKANYATANNVDVIEDDSTLQIGITRGNNGGIYNPFTEEEWDEDVSPDGTEWNIDGWDDLTDVETRTYTNFDDAYGGNLGNRVPRSKAVMYVPSIDKYYAIQWLSWTQGQNEQSQGGGFSYLRYEIDLDKLDEGITFPDGTVQKTAYIPTNVKLTAPGDRRIEEASGYKSVSVTERILRNLTTTASRNYDGNSVIWFDRTTTTIDEILNDREAAGIIDNTTIEFSLDNTTWYKLGNGELSSGDEKGYGVNLNGATLTYDQGDTVYFRYVGGGAPVVWWDKDDLPNGSSDFRGAVIDYHAYIPGMGTIVGTIHIVDDDGEDNITHTEVSSGASDLEYSDLWYVTNEGEIQYRQLDNNSRTLKIQWTAKVFYGSEYYND
jgi:hypothetical protein